MHVQQDRSIADVLKDISGNLQQMIRAEIRLARMEAKEDVGKVGQAATLAAVGAAFGVMALGFVLVAAMYLLARVVAPWLAAVIVAGGAAIIGAGLLAAGRARLRQIMVPPRTVTAFQENMPWANVHTK